ncbi:MAG: glutamine-hydrolyzing carbamoyl-phosphate synthase small subunit [Clostridiales Family XIII bacterium]|jgi:carbamoyl-phosphate synthase small subunit|nr:glutamine-hydrolyzing carbamoyl-phosphate synthase small subunit [Clostridiales Family XIII bacterium]
MTLSEGLIYLADGTVWRGKGFGAPATNVGELVFNTSMTGYQGILTDPSYAGQVINMTYPLIGNYGVSEIDYQSERIHAFGFVTRDITKRPSNRCSVMNLSDWLARQGVPGVHGVDTRAITKKIRTEGTVPCVISSEGIPKEKAQALLADTPLRWDYMRRVGTREPRHIPGDGPRVAVYDFGVKSGITDALSRRGCDLHILPYGATAEDILALQPDGLFLSNGPGDPEQAVDGIRAVRAIIACGALPVFGICLGHQIIALALGGRTYKLKFGHRGANHGVIDIEQDRSAITSQNHSFAVDADSIEAGGLIVTHRNLNDGTVEGMRHRELPVFSVQFHPEGSPGPNDTAELFDRFLAMMQKGKGDDFHA